jgi:hypothetical protein
LRFHGMFPLWLRRRPGVPVCSSLDDKNDRRTVAPCQ